MNMVETGIQQAPAFDFSANWLCLDFANTVHDRLTDYTRDDLNSYADLAAWSQQAGQVTDDTANLLLEQATQNPKAATAALQRARDLREVIYRIFQAIGEGMSLAEADLHALNTVLAEAMSHACIVHREGGFVWDWEGDEHILDRPLWLIARSAADLLTTTELDAVRVCAAEDCNWLFLDTSKNRTRRWCSMKGCGNRAKARRHYKKGKSKE